MPAPFRLYDTARREVLPFEPLTPGHVSLYVCGVTVYDESHVGHARAMVVFDAFVRWLRHRDWQVRFVRNFTDIDDKIIRRAAERGEDPIALADRYVAAFHRDADSLGLLAPCAEPRVSSTIDGIVEVVQRLIDRGHAYAAEGSVWFDVHSDPDYGSLSGRRLGDLRASDEQEAGKRDPRDFALWKGTRPGEPAWPSPWGPGRPGWHIECTAMIRACLGDTIDIHGGGLDLVFPHHENERAQGTCASGHPYARWWMHNGLITRVKHTDQGVVHDAKMGKSLGNVVNIREAVAAYPAEALRLYYLAAHYRAPLPWTETSLDDALAMLARLYEARDTAAGFGGSEPVDAIVKALGPDAAAVIEQADAFEARMADALDDDFHTARAISIAFELARAVNRLSNHKLAGKRAGPIGARAVAALDQLQVLGLLTRPGAAFDAEVKAKRLPARGLSTDTIEAALADRAQARADRDWARADAIRAELERQGIVVMDRPGGVDWKLDLTPPADSPPAAEPASP